MNRLLLEVISIFTRFKYLGSNINISPLAYFSSDCYFEGQNFIDRFCNLHKVKLGRYSYIGARSKIINANIGRFCSIASDVKIGLGIHPTEYVSTSPLFYSNKNPFKIKWVTQNRNILESKKITIGNDVWIGTDVIIFDGIIIEDGAIIGAGSVVTKNVQSYTIVAGIPAKEIRPRFNLEIKEKIHQSKWWDLPDKELINISEFMNDPNTFIRSRSER